MSKILIVSRSNQLYVTCIIVSQTNHNEAEVNTPTTPLERSPWVGSSRGSVPRQAHRKCDSVAAGWKLTPFLTRICLVCLSLLSVLVPGGRGDVGVTWCGNYGQDREALIQESRARVTLESATTRAPTVTKPRYRRWVCEVSGMRDTPIPAYLHPSCNGGRDHSWQEFGVCSDKSLTDSEYLYLSVTSWLYRLSTCCEILHTGFKRRTCNLVNAVYTCI